MAAKPKKRKPVAKSHRRPLKIAYGTLQDGVVQLDEPLDLPEGSPVAITEVRRRTGERKRRGAPTAWGRALLKHAGSLEGLPPDFSAQHDHYIHGAPKR